MCPTLADVREPPALRATERALYALTSFGGGVPHFLLLVYFLKYATDVLRIEAALVATMFAGVRVWDAISDVLFGAWSDRTRTRFGRRRPWMAIGAVGLAVAIPAVWAPPALDPTVLAAWMTCALIAYFTAHTAVYVPYGALGVELTRGPDDRTRLFAHRHVAYMLAMVGGIGVIAALTRSADPRSLGTWIGAGGAVAVLLGVLPLCVGVREPAIGEARETRTLARMARAIAGDDQARLLFGIAFAQRTGSAAVSALGPFVTAVLIGDESALPLLLGTYVAAGLVVTPWIARVARRVGTARLWRATMAIATMAFVGLGFVSHGAVGQLLVCAVVIGAAHACSAVLDRTLLAAAIDRAAAKSGVRDEALYVAISTFVDKTAFALAVFIAGVGLSSAGYTPEIAGRPDVAIALRVMIAGVPVLGYAAGLLLSFRVRLLEARRDGVVEGGEA